MNTFSQTPKWLIAMDTETGGIPDEVSILTAYFALCKLENNILTIEDELDLKIKPDNRVYRITAESLEINKINLVNHEKNAIFEKAAGQLLYKKLSEWYGIAKDKLIPLGHNIGFDIRKITTTLLTKGNWDNFVSYRTLDTCTIAQFFRLSGKLPDGLSCSVVNLSEFFQISVDGAAHEAKYDTLVTIEIFNHLKKLTI